MFLKSPYFIFEALKDKLSQGMKEQKRQSKIQEELIRKQGEMAKKQDETNVGIAALLDMMKKQQQP